MAAAYPSPEPGIPSHQPDFGVLFDDMEFFDGDEVPMARLAQPKVEAEVAFVVGRDLRHEAPSWGEFVALYEPLLVRYVRKKGLGEHDAHDVVQNIFVALLRKLPTFELDREKGRFRTWLWQVTHNAVIDWGRGTARVKQIEEQVRANWQEGVEEPDQEWDVLCYNEIGVFSEPASRYVLNCPHCGGMKIKAFPKGKIKRYQMPDDDQTEPIVNRWLRAAFANGEFVPVAMNGEIPPATARVPMNGEGQTCDSIKRSPDFKDEVLGKLSPLSAATILDAVFVARREISRDSRISDRVSTCVKLLAGNIDPAKVKVAESPDGDGVVYDILDAASVLGIEKTAGFWMAVNR